MTPEKQERLQACLQELAALLYEETNNSELAELESIEKTVRDSDVRTGQPPNSPFFIEQTTGIKTGKARKVKSCVGMLKLRTRAAQKLGLKPRSQLSPLLEKCCLRLAANESYQSAEAESCCPDWGQCRTHYTAATSQPTGVTIATCAPGSFRSECGWG
jgi:hypothetical protein